MLRLLLYVILLILTSGISIITSVGPTLNDGDMTTCEEFGRFGRFNPYSVLNDWWIAFYYWGPTQPTLHVKFTLPKPKEILFLKHHFEGHLVETINWTAPIILLHELDNFTHVLFEKGDRGQYLYYTPVKDLGPTQIIQGTHVRIKQTDNGRYMGFMICPTRIVYALSRFSDLPRKSDIQDVAAKLGFKARGGKSYLYQGHEWMPVPEADDDFMEPWRQTL